MNQEQYHSQVMRDTFREADEWASLARSLASDCPDFARHCEAFADQCWIEAARHESVVTASRLA